jgi:hypothetical protein
MMKVSHSQRLPTLVIVAFGLVFVSNTGVLGKGFDGVWSVSFVADDANCATHVIPVQVTDGIVSFSGFGATATGAISPGGAVKFSLSFNEQTVRIDGTVRGHSGKGRWSAAPEGCRGEWSAQMPE